MRIACIALLVAACGTMRRPPPAPPRHAHLGLTISSFVLPNGLRVVLVRDPRATEIQVTTRYQVGSVDDPPKQAGMAHLVEHLMYEQSLGAQSLFAHLEDTATYFNAHTTFDATTFVARAQAEHLDRLLSIEAARVQPACSSISASAFARERAVVINELTQRDQATDTLAAIHQAIYPPNHPYRRAVGGSIDSVAAISHAQACQFADAHYAPGNAVLVVSGNLTQEQVDAALGKYTASAPRRAASRPTPVHRVLFQPQTIKVMAPLDDDALLLVWPLPYDPQLRAKYRAIVGTAVALVDAEVAGSVMSIELGDTRAPMIGVVAVRGSEESLEALRTGVERGIAKLPETFDRNEISTFDELAFDRVQQTAIYKLYASLEDGAERDARLASYVIEGRDPDAALHAELQGLRELTRQEATYITRTYLNVPRAVVLALEATGKKRGQHTALTATIHDRGQRRSPPNPADALRPAPDPAPVIVGMRTRKLPNGLEVVLLPLTSVPTVEMRLVFRAGTADEPPDRRGVAVLAAKALSWDLRYLKDLVLFTAVGGSNLVDVGPDRTTFSAHGVDMHLDLLLAGLRRWIREGTYDEIEAALAVMRRERTRGDVDGPANDAWREAMFGADHPYAKAGIIRHASEKLAAAHVTDFRKAHYTPDNATLVIAGHFDPDIADNWIDYLFADWNGRSTRRGAPRAAPRPASIARADDLSQIHVRIAVPATEGGRAERLVASEMLSQIAGDVRHQLGASYTFGAQLGESRLATSYVIAGWVDAARAAAALELLHVRLAKLRADADVAARSFVTARNRVLVQLGSFGGSASAMAARVEHDVALDRTAMFDLPTAGQVKDLTIDRMTATLSDLDLSRAIIAMRGPLADMRRAFDVLGRTPTNVPVEAIGQPLALAPSTRPPASDKPLPELADPLTLPSWHSPLAWTFAPGLSFAVIDKPSQVDLECCAGLTLTADIGYRFGKRRSAGGRFTLGSLKGTYSDNGVTGTSTLAVVDLGGYIHQRATERLWGGALVGLHVDYVVHGGTRSRHLGLGVGAEGGVDFTRVGRSVVAAYLRAEHSFFSSSGFSALTFGIALTSRP
jgi:zinc protease